MQKIGIKKVKFLRSGRHINEQFWVKIAENVSDSL